MLVHCDTDVYLHACHVTGPCSIEDRRTFEAARIRGIITPVFVPLVFEEVQCLPMFHDKFPQKEYDFILRQMNARMCVKEHSHLLKENLKAYSKGLPPPSPYMDPKEGVEIAGKIRNIKLPVTLKEQVHLEKEEVMQGFRESTERVMVEVKKFRKQNHGKRPDFVEFYNHLSLGLLETLAGAFNLLPECKAVGITGLLNIPCVQMYVGVHASLLFAFEFERRSADYGDSRDIWHAIMASSSELFVTDDRRLFRILSRIPQRPVTVVHRLRNLLEIVENK